jgi:hypothetical protein
LIRTPRRDSIKDFYHSKCELIMSDPDDDFVDSGTSVLRSKRRKNKRLKSSSEETDSDIPKPSFSKLKKTPAREHRQCESSEDQTPIKGVNVLNTPATRTSERLKVKNSREFRLPSRDEVLDQVSPGNIQCPRLSEQKIKELRPRRLVNNFIRE